ncbi:unnamed protein product [Closterium sp. NIES-54]
MVAAAEAVAPDLEYPLTLQLQQQLGLHVIEWFLRCFLHEREEAEQAKERVRERERERRRAIEEEGEGGFRSRGSRNRERGSRKRRASALEEEEGEEEAEENEEDRLPGTAAATRSRRARRGQGRGRGRGAIESDTDEEEDGSVLGRGATGSATPGSAARNGRTCNFTSPAPVGAGSVDLPPPMSAGFTRHLGARLAAADDAALMEFSQNCLIQEAGLLRCSIINKLRNLPSLSPYPLAASSLLEASQASTFQHIPPSPSQTFRPYISTSPNPPPFSAAEIARFVAMLRSPSTSLRACAAFALLQLTMPHARHTTHHINLLSDTGASRTIRATAAATTCPPLVRLLARALSRNLDLHAREEAKGKRLRL